MKSVLQMTAIAIVLSAGAAACAGDGSQGEKRSEPRETPRKMIQHNAPAALISQVTDDLVARTGAQRDQIFIRRAEAVTWNDGSLGCPEPGMAYPQVIVDGYWIELEHSGQIYDYRAGRGGQFKLCTQKNRMKPVPGGGAL